MIELRCNGTLHGIVDDAVQTLEVKCKRRSCGAGPGIIVLHTISLTTGEVVDTKRFAEPQKTKGSNHAR